MTDFEVQYWLSPSDIEQLEYSEYWNDEEKEEGKEWYILDGNFAKMEEHLEKTGLVHQLQQCLTFLRDTLNRPLRGVGAGNLWAVPYLINEWEVERIYSLEYSRHRLLKIGPKVLEHYEVPHDKVVLCLGSFYELKLPSHSLDFVLLSSAFHHADRPDSLLAEIRRVLKPNGCCLIIGEHIIAITPFTFMKHFVRFLLSHFVPRNIQTAVFGRTFYAKTMIPKREAIPPDPILGDHYYSDSQYRRMFLHHNFRYYRIEPPRSHFQAFVLISNGS